MDRIEDPALMAQFRAMRCQNRKCKTPWISVSGHHIKSRGSWGPDMEINLIPLCFYCHTKIHQYGLVKFLMEAAGVEDAIKEKGWYRQIIGEGRNQIERWFNDDVKC